MYSFFSKLPSITPLTPTKIGILALAVVVGALVLVEIYNKYKNKG